MKKIFFLLLTSTSLCLSAQQQVDLNLPVPLDPKVRIGKLNNGLTYYIRKNNEPQQRAEFFIVQNVGAILEEDNQNGLAHFLEHMAFNGTKNYPDKKLFTYFESIGVKFGQNINAATSLDETIYNLSDVPTIREGIIDSSLLVLHDWSGFISLENKEIDNERGVIREEWRTGSDANSRMQKELMPLMLKGSKYAIRDIIGDTSIINNFDYKVIKDYYHKWYRPDLQSIIVVGDVDVDRVEQKIKQLWADIPKRENLAPRPSFELPDNTYPLIGVATDAEASNTIITILCKQPATPKESKNLGYLKVSVERSLISSMLNARIEELVQAPNPPFVYAGVNIGSMVRTKDAFSFMVAAKNGMVIDGLKASLTEMQRVKLFGFTITELERVKADFLRGLENQFNEKDKAKNGKYVNECINNFLVGEPMSGIEFEYMFLSNIIPSITIDEINAYAKSLITDQNIIITVTGPKKDDIRIPSVDEILSVQQEIKKEKIEVYTDNVSNKPLVAKDPIAGKVKRVKNDKSFGTTEWKLSNGAKVVFKKTDFKADEIQMVAFSEGGTSLADINMLPSASLASELIINGGVGEFSSTELEKMLAGKIVKVQPFIKGTYEGFSGGSSTKDFKTMLQLIYLYFTQPREDVQTYNSYMERLRAYIANNDADPMKAYNDSISEIMANRNPRVMPLNNDYLRKVDYRKSLDFFKDRFADASDFVFVFTGNIDPDEVKYLIETYLGGLPSTNRSEKARDNKVRPPKGKIEKHFIKPLQTKKSSIFISFTGKERYNLENMVLIDFIQSILTIRYTDEIREKEGASYGVRVKAYVDNFPSPSFDVQVTFETDPKVKDKTIGIVYKEIENLIEKGTSEEIFNKNKEFLLKTHEQNQRENKYWLSAIYTKYTDGIDINSKYVEVVNGLTIAKIKSTAKKLFDQENVIEVVMSPQE